MKTVTVIGPLATREQAEKSANYLGTKNHSVYSMAVKDSEGYDTDKRLWFVERDLEISSETIFGYSFEAIQAKQQKRKS